MSPENVSRLQTHVRNVYGLSAETCLQTILYGLLLFPTATSTYPASRKTKDDNCIHAGSDRISYFDSAATSRDGDGGRWWGTGFVSQEPSWTALI